MHNHAKCKGGTGSARHKVAQQGIVQGVKGSGGQNAHLPVSRSVSANHLLSFVFLFPSLFSKDFSVGSWTVSL